MRAGQMRHLVKVLVRRTTQSASGAQSTTWDVEDERWAAIRPLTGGELFAAQQVNATLPHEFRFRYFEGLTPSKRLQWGARLFDVKSAAMVDGLRHELLVLADELVEETA